MKAILSNKSPLNESQEAEFRLMSRPVVRLRRGVTSFGLTKDAAAFNRRKSAERTFAMEYYGIPA